MILEYTSTVGHIYSSEFVAIVFSRYSWSVLHTSYAIAD